MDDTGAGAREVPLLANSKGLDRTLVCLGFEDSGEQATSSGWERSLVGENAQGQHELQMP